MQSVFNHEIGNCIEWQVNFWLSAAPFSLGWFPKLVVIACLFLFFAKTGITGGPQPFLELRKESKSPISSTNLFEVVADDLQKLNQNLLSVSGRELSTVLYRFGVLLLLRMHSMDFNLIGNLVYKLCRLIK